MRHATLVQRSWLDSAEAAPGVPEPRDDGVDAYLDGFRFDADGSLDDLLADFDEVSAAVLDAVRRLDLDTPVPVPDAPWFPQDVEAWSVRWVWWHLMEELARHAGHGDIVRETARRRHDVRPRGRPRRPARPAVPQGLEAGRGGQRMTELSTGPTHLHDQLDFHWQHRLRPRLEGLTDDEYLWEPVPGCWSIRAARAPPATPPAGGELVAGLRDGPTRRRRRSPPSPGASPT